MPNDNIEKRDFLEIEEEHIIWLGPTENWLDIGYALGKIDSNKSYKNDPFNYNLSDYQDLFVYSSFIKLFNFTEEHYSITDHGNIFRLNATGRKALGVLLQQLKDYRDRQGSDGVVATTFRVRSPLIKAEEARASELVKKLKEMVSDEIDQLSSAKALNIMYKDAMKKFSKSSAGSQFSAEDGDIYVTESGESKDSVNTADKKKESKDKESKDKESKDKENKDKERKYKEEKRGSSSEKKPENNLKHGSATSFKSTDSVNTVDKKESKDQEKKKEDNSEVKPENNLKHESAHTVEYEKIKDYFDRSKDTIANKDIKINTLQQQLNNLINNRASIEKIISEAFILLGLQEPQKTDQKYKNALFLYQSSKVAFLTKYVLGFNIKTIVIKSGAILPIDFIKVFSIGNDLAYSISETSDNKIIIEINTNNYIELRYYADIPESELDFIILKYFTYDLVSKLARLFVNDQRIEFDFRDQARVELSNALVKYNSKLDARYVKEYK